MPQASFPSARTRDTFVSPIVESRRWLQGLTLPADLPLLNLSQAAPADPPPEGLRRAIAEAALTDDSSHLYGEVLGRDELRAALADKMNRHYAGDLSAAEVAITSGCNQAFAATIAALCGEGDQVILPTPWYFNHKMWLDMQGVVTCPLPVGAAMLPCPDAAAKLITDRTRAIVLVTPNNPCGVEYPDGLVQRFYDLARAHGLTLIVDETYRDFDSRNGPPHTLFQDPNWSDTLIHLYSFSKAYRLTGHRLGAIAAHPGQLLEMEKFLDTVTICPAQLGQTGALWGLENLDDWLAGERQELLNRRAAIETGFAPLAAQGWQLLGCGAYFAYVAHPFAASSDELARRLVKEAGILMLPGSMFTPDGDPTGARQFRIAFANVDTHGIRTFFERLTNWTA
ncbi:aminotransferase [Phaeobacter inhibens]|uniref:aminotransferase n=1 Tax=Phaeobacter inhibens TaxID=221822 RepID=UPI0021A2C5FA|nr:aminotransferase [Phaeobacter inhibens]UWS09655.1 aminotransferase [Phaeobacter inhibens]